jgi:heme A synthase
MYDFLAGVATAGFLIAAVFFFRFWKTTRDSFFAILGIAFVLFAANQAGVALLEVFREEQSWLYVLRLIGFVLLLVAIVLKNIPGRGPEGSDG